MYQFQKPRHPVPVASPQAAPPPAVRRTQQRQANGPMTVEECKNYINQKIIPNSRYQRIEQDTAGDIDQFNASRVREDLKTKTEPSFTSNLFENKRVIPPARSGTRTGT